jgi:hypothetical protein
MEEVLKQSIDAVLMERAGELLRREPSDLATSLTEQEFEALAYYLTRQTAEAQRIREALSAMLDGLNENIEAAQKQYGDSMREYAAQRIKGERKKEFPSVAGLVKVRKLPDRLDILDDVKLTNWCLKHAPEAVRYEVRGTVDREQLSTLQSLQEEGMLPSFKVTLSPLKKAVDQAAGTTTPDGCVRLTGRQKITIDAAGGKEQILATGIEDRRDET